jgi:hypothetical protein
MLENMILINDKVFVVHGRCKGSVKAVCPTGRICYIDFNSSIVLHRDSSGKIQSEPFNF